MVTSCGPGGLRGWACGLACGLVRGGAMVTSCGTDGALPARR